MKNTHNCLPPGELAALVVNYHQLPTAEATTSERVAAEGKPDIIYTGTIVTMDETLPAAEAIAFKGTSILAVGAKDEVLRLAGPATKKVDLGSRVMYPGLIESHMHLWVTAINYDWIDCSAFENKTVEAVKQRIAEAVKTAKPGEWVKGKLFDPSLLPGMPDLTVADLDPIAPNNPVFIFNASMHFAYVNSKALEVAGITKDTPDPAGGYYGRDKEGNLNGVLSEMSAIAPFLQNLDGITTETVARNAVRIGEDAAAVGVTTMREAASGALFGEKEVGLLHHIQQAGRLKTRVSLALVDDMAQTWPKSSQTAMGAGNDMVWIGARKIVTDGSNQGESGYQTKPYLHSESRGKLDIDVEAFKKRLAWCRDNDWQVMVHANGDAAVETVTHAMHEVLSSSPQKDVRFRIEHCSMVNDDTLFDLMHDVGVTPSFLINHVYYWGKTMRDNVFGRDRIHMLDRTAAAVKAGLRFTMHSDYNVSPINPLHYVKVAATRTMWDGGEVLEADQKVSVHQALRAVTIDAAWQIHADDRLGSLTPGKFADYIILDQDPQQVDPEKIDNTAVLETWLGGQQTFKAG